MTIGDACAFSQFSAPLGVALKGAFGSTVRLAGFKGYPPATSPPLSGRATERDALFEEFASTFLVFVISVDCRILVVSTQESYDLCQLTA